MMSKNRLENSKNENFAIGKENYKLIIIGLIAIVIGFILMTGGRSDDPNVFNHEIFNFRRIKLAPTIVFGGFIFIIYAIMKKPKLKE
jgi:hypothetical protein